MEINIRKVLYLIAPVVLAIMWGKPLAALVQSDADRQSLRDQTRDDSARDIQELKKEIEDLRQEVATLRRSAYLRSTTAAAPQFVNLVQTLPASALGDVPVQDTAPAQNAAPASTASSGPTLSGLLGPTSLSGFVDGYYQQNFQNPTTRTSSLHSFDTFTNQFGLNLIELVVDKTPTAENSRTGYHVALGYGQAINAINATDPGGLGFSQYLKEGYFSYLAPVGKGLQVDFGKFVTPAGAEVIETKDNWNYTRGLLFNFAIPFFHYGLRAKYTFNDKYSLTGLVVNGWNNIVDNNTGKTGGLSFGWNPTKKVAVTETYIVGPEGNNNNNDLRQLTDTVVTYSPTAKLSFMTNYDYARGDRITPTTRPVFWSAVAGYAKYAFTSSYAVATRYEHYDDHNGFTTGIPATATTPFIPTPQSLNGVTGTFEHIIAGHIISRFEYRRDMSTRPTFFRGLTPVKSQNILTGGLVFVFDSKEKSN
jgi:hypothetical protein